MHDIRIAFRQFLKSPGFALTVIVTIALGVGANTAIFTLVHAVLIKSLPVVDPKTLYRIGDKDDCCVNGCFLNDDGDFDIFSYELYGHFRDNSSYELLGLAVGLCQRSFHRGLDSVHARPASYGSGHCARRILR